MFNLCSILVFVLTWSEPGNLGSNINSNRFDEEAQLDPTGTILYFTSDRNGPTGSGDDIFASVYSGGQWQPAVFQGNVLNIQGYSDQGPCPHPNPAIHELYFSSQRPGVLGGYDIWVAQGTMGNWQTPTLVNGVNTTYDEMEPSLCVVAGQEKMYFTSNREGGGMNYDLYVSTKTGGVWQTPVNLGPVVNSSSYDMSPSISSDDLSLYFTSGRVAGNAIYVTHKIGGVWCLPQILPPPISMQQYESGASINQPCLLYFDSIRSGGYGQKDIYSSIGNVGLEPTSLGKLKLIYK